MTNIQFLLLSIVVLSAGIVMLNWRVSRAHRRIDGLKQRIEGHDAGFLRILDWHPDEGGIVRVRAKVVRMRFGKRGTIYEQDQAG